MLLISPKEGDLLGERVVVPASLRERIFQQLHGSLTSCHFGVDRTREGIQSRYYWPHMKDDIKCWIKSCITCATRKSKALEGRNVHASVLSR